MLVFIFAGALFAVLMLLFETDGGRRFLASLAATVAGWAVFTVQHLAPEIAAEALATILESFQALKPTLYGAAVPLIKEMTGQDVDVPTLFSAGAPSDIYTGVGQAFSGVADGIVGAVAPDGDLTPESGMDNLRRLFSVGLGTALQSWLIGYVPDLLHLGQLRSAAEFHRVIEKGLGFQRLGYRMWQAPIQEGITKPLQRLYARRYAFAIPGATEAVKGWYGGVYTDDEFTDLMLSAGFNYSRAQELLNVGQRHLTPAEAEEALNRGLIDDTGLDPVLRADTLGKDRAAIVKALMVGRRGQKELDSIVTTARALYLAGDLDEDTYRAYLAQAHWREDEVNLALTADQLAARKAKQLTVADLGNLLQAGAITQDDYRARLRKQHYEDGDIDLLMALKVKRLSPAQTIALHSAGKLSDSDAAGKLKAFGYAADDATALLAAHNKRLSEGQVLDALKQQRITTAQARTDLAALGYAADQVDLLLAFQAKTLSAADIQALVLRGDLSEVAATQKLAQQGYSAADAAALVSLRSKLLTSGQVGAAYEAGALSRSQALADLMARGLTQAEAQLIVQGFDRVAATNFAKAQAAAAKAAAAAAKAAGTSGTPPQA